MLEFGVNEGRTAAAILRTFPLMYRYLGVEVDRAYKTPLSVQQGEVPRARVGVWALPDPRFTLLVKPHGSHDVFAEELKPPFDVVFIDGDHSRQGVLHDTCLARAVVRPGGLIIWHDYSPQSAVVDVLDAMCAAGRAIRHIEDTWLAYGRIGRGASVHSHRHAHRRP
jgi:hypothetical protein